MTRDQEKFLTAVVRVWPKNPGTSSLDVNALYVGKIAGFTEGQTKEIIQTLVELGLLHSREIDGVFFIHPTPVALANTRIHRIQIAMHQALVFFWPFGK
jgi:hypothetical protein